MSSPGPGLLTGAIKSEKASVSFAVADLKVLQKWSHAPVPVLNLDGRSKTEPKCCKLQTSFAYVYVYACTCVLRRVYTVSRVYYVVVSHTNTVFCTSRDDDARCVRVF